MDRQINLEFLSGLKDPTRMVAWCMESGMITRMYKCPQCDKGMHLVRRSGVNDGMQWRCSNGGHDIRRSIRKGSWFELSRISMYEVLKLTYLWCLKVPSDSIIYDMNLSTVTVANWKSFCRGVCVDACVADSDKLGGEGATVELVGTKFGNRKHQRGTWVQGKWVYAGIERGTVKCFMIVVPKRDKQSLLKVIREYVNPGSVVISDCWNAYDCLEDEHFRQLILDQRIEFQNPENADGTWAAIKRKLSPSHCQDHFDDYMFEYMWRRRHRYQKRTFINNFLKAIVHLYPPCTQDN